MSGLSSVVTESLPKAALFLCTMDKPWRTRVDSGSAIIMLQDLLLSRFFYNPYLNDDKDSRQATRGGD